MAPSKVSNGLVRIWKLVRAASTDPVVTKSDIAVLMAILDRMGKNDSAWPGVTTIARDGATSDRNAMRSINRLCDRGYLLRESGGKGKSNRYRVASLATDSQTSTDTQTSTDSQTSTGVDVSTDTQTSELLTARSVAVPVCVSVELATSNLLQELATPEASSLRSDSSSPSADDPSVPKLELKPPEAPAHLSATKAERLRQVTADAIESYNTLLAKPKGLLPKVTKIGIDKRQALVKRCLRTAREICEEVYKSPAITRRFWDIYFATCRGDDFLSGRQGGGKDHENWTPNFEYLTRDAVMIKIFDQASSEVEAA